MMTLKLIDRIKKVRNKIVLYILPISLSSALYNSLIKDDSIIDVFTEDFKSYGDNLVYELFYKCHNVLFGTSDYAGIVLQDIDNDMWIKIFDLMERYAANWNYS